MRIAHIRSGALVGVVAALLAFAALPAAPALAISGSAANIVNDPNLYPFVGRFQAAEKKGYYLCSAILIAPRFVLTAAHCVAGREFSTERVSFGGIRISDPHTYGVSPDGSFSTGVTEATIMPKTDLAMLLLDRPVPNRPVPLPVFNDRPLWQTGAGARVVGWGFLDRKGTISAELRQADQEITDASSTTNKIFGRYYEMKAVPAGPLVGSIEGGDSGGPLLGRKTDGTFVAIGLTSQGTDKCGQRLCQGYYVKLGQQEVLDWIQQTEIDLLATHTTLYSLLVRASGTIGVGAIGETFFHGSYLVDYATTAGKVYLAGSADGQSPFYVDDVATVTVTRPDGTTTSITVDFSNGCSGLQYRPSLDLTSLVQPGINSLDVTFSDRCGDVEGSTDVYLLGENALLAQA